MLRDQISKSFEKIKAYLDNLLTWDRFSSKTFFNRCCICFFYLFKADPFHFFSKQNSYPKWMVCITAMNNQNQSPIELSETIPIHDLTNLLPDGVILVDGDGAIRFINAQVSRIFQYAKSELIGQKIEVLVPEHFQKGHVSNRSHYIKKPKKMLMNRRDILYGRRKDGTQVSVEVSLGSCEINGSTFILSVIRDTSSRKHIELLESKNKELEQFAYVASHDLQEPLRTITGLIYILNKDHGHQFDEVTSQYLSFISKAGNRMSDLITGLLNYARLGQEKGIGQVDTKELIDGVLDDMSILIKETDTSFEISPLPTIWGFETLLRQLFQNIINNAIKFRRLDVTPVIKIKHRIHGDFERFSIEDNGIGIAERHSEKIFDIFQRLHDRKAYEGTGIGLAHCRKIVELHGGIIGVESRLNYGSTFYFTIPKR
jgi:PAS domain S-box-containing protein